jgi:hypothetical protein
MGVIYDYIQARMAQDPLTQEFNDLLAHWAQANILKPLVLTANGWETRRSPIGGAPRGVYIGNESGSVNLMQANTGTFTPPVTVNLTYTGLKDNTEVRVYETGTTTELAGVENATDGTPDNRSVTFSLTASTAVDVRFMNQDWIVPDRNSILNFTWPTTTTSIPITQVLDRSFDNPA